MDLATTAQLFLTALAYCCFGLVIFGIASWVIMKLPPFSLRKEVADAVVTASVILGMAIIIAAAMHG